MTTMMDYKSQILAVILTLFFTLALAQQHGDMSAGEIQSGQPMYSSTPTMNHTPSQDEGCRVLYDKTIKLKGKPQRHYAAVQRYKEECTASRNWKGE